MITDSIPGGIKTWIEYEKVLNISNTSLISASSIECSDIPQNPEFSKFFPSTAENSFGFFSLRLSERIEKGNDNITTSIKFELKFYTRMKRNT